MQNCQRRPEVALQPIVQRSGSDLEHTTDPVSYPECRHLPTPRHNIKGPLLALQHDFLVSEQERPIEQKSVGLCKNHPRPWRAARWTRTWDGWLRSRSRNEEPVANEKFAENLLKPMDPTD